MEKLLELAPLEPKHAEPIFAVFVTCWGITFLLVAVFCVVFRQRLRRALHFADLAVTWVIFTLIPIWAVKMTPGLFSWDPSERVTSPSESPASRETEELLYLYIGKQLHHVPILFAGEGAWKDFQQTMLMFAHHFLSVGGYLSVLLLGGHLKFYTVSALISEGSTPFMLFTNLMNKTGWKNTRIGGILHVGNGIFLWLAFFFLRVLLFPPIFYLYISDWDLIIQRAGKIDGCACFSVLVFLWVLSLFWFSKIHAGLMKALKSSPEQKMKEV
jgi:hypothetical protein